MSFQETETNRQLANLFGLPFILLEHVFDFYKNIATELMLRITDIEQLLQYFSKTYLYGTRFPPSRWTYFSSIEFTDRTNNALEGYHGSINAQD